MAKARLCRLDLFLWHADGSGSDCAIYHGHGSEFAFSIPAATIQQFYTSAAWKGESVR